MKLQNKRDIKDMKLIMENWRGYLKEAPEDPTVAEFLAVFAKQHPRSFSSILKIGARQVASIAAGALTATAAGAAVGAATGGIATVGAGAVGYAAGAKVSEEVLNRIFGKVAEASAPLARFMVQMAQRQVDDDNRAGIDNYYDIDDEYENLIGGIDSELGQNFTKHLFNTYERAFANIDETEDGAKPLKDFIAYNANDYFKRFLLSKKRSGIGVAVNKPDSPGRIERK